MINVSDADAKVRFGSMCSAFAYVRFGPIADSCTAANYFLFDHVVGARNARKSFADSADDAFPR